MSDGRFKLVVDLLTGKLALFDVQSEPAEAVDVAQARPAEFRRLREVLYEFLLETEGGIGSKKSLAGSREVEEMLKSLGYLQ